jgi:hypothetical protein
MLDIRDLLNLKEAYAEVYASQELTEEQVWEEVETWVNSLIEEGYDLSDYTWEEMYESYIEEQGRGRSSGASPGSLGYKPKPMGTETGRQLNQVFGQGNKLLGSAPRNTPAPGTRQNLRGGGSRPDPRAAARPSSSPIPRMANLGAGYKSAELQQSAKASASQVGTTRTGAGGVSVGGGNAGASRQQPPAKSAPAITNTPSAKPTATTAAKPAAPAAKQTGDKTKDMATFAKANPKLAASAAERDRTRGTSATTNPLMKDMKSRLPAPKTPSPTTAKTGFDLAKKGVNLAAGFDMFDVVKGYLIGEGYADTEEAALAIMTNMSEEWKQSIIKSI